MLFSRLRSYFWPFPATLTLVLVGVIGLPPAAVILAAADSFYMEVEYE